MSRLICLAGLLAAGAAPAADVAGERDWLADMPTVLTASRLLQPVAEAPVTMSVIDRDTIVASGLRSLPELLRLVPGVYVRPGNSSNEGLLPVVSYHGLGNEFSRRMQVLVDGRSVYMPPYSTVLWDELPLAIDDVERIEVSRGPNAATYGANAFLATVNIVTRTPVAGEGGQAVARVGGARERDALLRYTDGAAGRAWRLSAGVRRDDGDPGWNDTQRTAFLTGRMDIDLDARDALQLQAGGSGGRRQVGEATSPVNPLRFKTLQNLFAQARWQRTLGPGDEWSAQLDLSRRVMEESVRTGVLALPGLPPRSYAFDAGSRFTRTHVDVARTVPAAAGLRLVAGVSVEHDVVSAPLYFGGRERLHSTLARLFAQAEWRAAPALLLQGGAMLEHTSISGAELSPRASVTWHVNAGQSLRASVSRASRTPSLFEDQGDFGLDFGGQRVRVQATGGDLRTERLTSREIGWHAALRDGTLQADAKLYHDRATRLIDETSDPRAPVLFSPTTFLRNGEGATVEGVELEVTGRPWPRTRVVLAYAYTDVTTEAPLLQRTVPAHLLSLLVSQRVGEGWRLGSALYLTGPLPAQSGIFGQNTLQPVGWQRRLDVLASRESRAGPVPVRVAVGVQSLLGAVQEFRFNTLFDRRLFVEVGARF